MNETSLIFTIFILFCIYHNSSALDCECDIFQLSKNFSEENRYEVTNFTKQSGEINGRPFYFSITDERNIVWWNANASSWMIQTDDIGSVTTISEVKIDRECPNFSNTEDWEKLPQDSNVDIQSRCLKDRNKCQFNGEFDGNSIMYLKLFLKANFTCDKSRWLNMSKVAKKSYFLIFVLK